MEFLFGLVVVIAAVVAFFHFVVKRVTILEYERGVKYVNGRFREVLGPGQYWYLPYLVVVVKIDVRPRFVSIAGQEVLSSDGVTLKVSLAANYQIDDAALAVNTVQHFEQALYLQLQLALREIVGGADIETVLAERQDMSRKLQEMTQDGAAKLGLQLIEVSLKDVMFPGKLKEMFAQVVNARKEGLAALERARGETAALRSLSNAARMIESNPHLYQLRLLQTLGESSGNTVVLGMPASSIPVPLKASAATPPPGAGAGSTPDSRDE